MDEGPASRRRPTRAPGDDDVVQLLLWLPTADEGGKPLRRPWDRRDAHRLLFLRFLYRNGRVNS